MNLIKSLLSLALPVLVAAPASAHCDSLDGPVVEAARKALAGNDVKLALVWTGASGEAEIREAFRQTMAVRRQGGTARDLADRYFFETLVRVHRAGEGAPYTGLKPAGRDLGPALPLGDQALATGDLKPVERLLGEAAARRLRQTFAEARETRNYQPGDVVAGRRHTQAYVTYIHTVEGLYQATEARGHGSEGHAEAGHAAADHEETGHAEAHLAATHPAE